MSRLRIAAAAMSLFALAGCFENDELAKHLKPLSYATIAELKMNDMTKESPLLIRIYKEESELEVWKATSSGRFKHFKTYEICAWSGDLGPKLKEGDRQSPEGFYTVTPAQMNPNSSYHLSFNIGFPNTYDRAYGRTGKYLMVHGACSSAGCYAMTDDVVQEIYSLARESFRGGQRDFQVQALPFRMTPENMAKHADNPNMPFWRNLKQGVDHFEVTGIPPKVGVCDKTYVFNAEPANGERMDPLSVCPQLETPEEIRVAVQRKQMKDDMAYQVALAEIRGNRANDPSGPYSPFMVAGNGALEQGSSDGYGDDPQLAMTETPAPAKAQLQPAADTGAAPRTAAAQPLDASKVADTITGVWGRIVDMARSGLEEPASEAANEVDPIQTGTVPGATPTPAAPAAASGSLSRAFTAPELFGRNPFDAFKMFETVDGVSVPADTVAR